jgi:hypothetical protein
MGNRTRKRSCGGCRRGCGGVSALRAWCCAVTQAVEEHRKETAECVVQRSGLQEFCSDPAGCGSPAAAELRFKPNPARRTPRQGLTCDDKNTHKRQFTARLALQGLE